MDAGPQLDLDPCLQCSVSDTSQSLQVTLEQLREWLIDKLPNYQLPSRLEIVESIPRNAMGKVNKKDLRRQYFGV